MTKNDGKYLLINEKRHGTKLVYWVFIGILLFVAIYVPFFGNNLRYQTSNILNKVIAIFGAFCLTIGGIMVVFGFIGIFLRSGKWISWLLLGGLLVWIGCWLTGAPWIFDIFAPNGGGGAKGGYH